MSRIILQSANILSLYTHVKRLRKSSAKTIDLFQPAQPVQAEKGRKFLLLVKFLHVSVPCLCGGLRRINNIQLFNGGSSQIHVFWTIFNQYLTSPLSYTGWSIVVLFPP